MKIFSQLNDFTKFSSCNINFLESNQLGSQKQIVEKFVKMLEMIFMYFIITDVSRKMDGVLTSGEIQPISGLCSELKNRSLTRSPPSKPLGIKPKNSPIDKRFKKSATVTSDQTSGEYISNFMEILKTATIFQQNVLTKFLTGNLNFSKQKKPAKLLRIKPKNYPSTNDSKIVRL